LLLKNSGNAEGSAADAGKKKKGEMDTQKSIDEMSEDDLNFMPG